MITALLASALAATPAPPPPAKPPPAAAPAPAPAAAPDAGAKVALHSHPDYLIPATNQIVQEFADLLAVVATAQPRLHNLQAWTMATARPFTLPFLWRSLEQARTQGFAVPHSTPQAMEVQKEQLHWQQAGQLENRPRPFRCRRRYRRHRYARSEPRRVYHRFIH